MKSITKAVRGSLIKGLTASLVLGALLPAVAGASSLGPITLYSASQTVTSSNTQVFTSDFLAPTAGILTITVSDQLFPNALTRLDVSLWSGAGAGATLVSGPASGLGAPQATTPQEVTFNIDVTAGAYTTMFQAAATPTNTFPGSPTFALGLFNEKVTFTASAPAVPVPPLGGALAASVVMLGLVGFRRQAKKGDAVSV